MKNKQIKIVYFDFAVALGGSVVVLRNTLKSLDRSKIDPVVVTGLPDAEAEAFLGDLGAKVFTYHRVANYVSRFSFLNHSAFSLPWRRRLASYLFTIYSFVVNIIPFVVLLFRVATQRPDLIHTHNAIESMLISIILKVPAVLHIHGPFGAESAFEIWLAKRAKRCICVSRGLADMLIARGVNANNVVVIDNPSPVPDCDNQATAAYEQQYGFSSEKIKIAHVGRLVPWKGQREFLRAFFLVAKRYQNTLAIIVGGDVEGLNSYYVEELQRMVAESGWQDRVIFTGQIPDVHNLLAAVDIVIHSSTEPEPFGLVVTEAMALGKPVVASCHGATAEIVEAGITGALVEPTDEQALAEAINRMVADEPMRRRLGAAALEKARREYSLEGYYDKLQALYGAVLSHKR